MLTAIIFVSLLVVALFVISVMVLIGIIANFKKDNKKGARLEYIP